MTEEEVQALQEAKEAAETRAAEADAAAKAAQEAADKASSDLQNVVSELTDERKKKAEALEKLEKFSNPDSKDPEGAPDVSSLIQAELERREQERVKTDVESAIAEFKNSKTEFQSDSSGIVFEKFKKELGKFSFADVSSKEQARQRLEEAYRFVRGQQSGDEEPSYEGSNPSPATPPAGGQQLSQEVSKVIENAGISQDKFNSLASKYGDALSGLGFGSQK